MLDLPLVEDSSGAANRMHEISSEDNNDKIRLNEFYFLCVAR